MHKKAQQRKVFAFEPLAKRTIFYFYKRLVMALHGACNTIKNIFFNPVMTYCVSLMIRQNKPRPTFTCESGLFSGSTH